MPGLTTIDVHCTKLGLRTAETLLAKFASQTTPRATRIDLDLVVRGSSGPLRNSAHRHVRAGALDAKT